MRKVTLLLMTLVAVTRVAVGQVDVGAINRPIELLNEANADIENGDYKDAVQKLISGESIQSEIEGGLLVFEYSLYSHEPDFFVEGVFSERERDIRGG